MFIKILTPNHNGKLELTVRDLEALIQEAVDKAIQEDRANRSHQLWYDNGGGISKTNTTPNWDWNKVTCNDNDATLLNSSSNSNNNNKTGRITPMSPIRDIMENK